MREGENGISNQCNASSFYFLHPVLGKQSKIK